MQWVKLDWSWLCTNLLKINGEWVFHCPTSNILWFPEVRHGKRKLSVSVTFSPHRVAIRDLLHSQSAVLSCWYKWQYHLSRKFNFAKIFTPTNRPPVWRGYIFSLLWNDSTCEINGGISSSICVQTNGKEPMSQKGAFVFILPSQNRLTSLILVTRTGFYKQNLRKSVNRELVKICHLLIICSQLGLH